MKDSAGARRPNAPAVPDPNVRRGPFRARANEPERGFSGVAYQSSTTCCHFTGTHTQRLNSTGTQQDASVQARQDRNTRA